MESKAQIAVPRQLAILLDAPVLHRLTAAERAKAVALLARLLLEAGGTVEAEDDDERV